MEKERKYYMKPVTEVVNVEVSRLICTSVPDYWGYAPDRVDEAIAKGHTHTA